MNAKAETSCLDRSTEERNGSRAGAWCSAARRPKWPQPNSPVARLGCGVVLSILHAVAIVLAVAPASLVFAETLDDAVSVYLQQDYPTALQLMQALADRGDTTSSYYLGFMYENGQGVAKNDVLAAEWYRKAADKGFPPAQLKLGFMYHAGQGVPTDDVLAYAWYDLSAASGYRKASRARASLAARMNPAQIAEAKELSGQLKPRLR